MDGWMNGRLDIWKVGWMDRRTGGWMIEGWLDRWIVLRLDGLFEGQFDDRMDIRKVGWMD